MSGMMYAKSVVVCIDSRSVDRLALEGPPRRIATHDNGEVFDEMKG